jgi:SAM-dependent methyltransferase
MIKSDKPASYYRMCNPALLSAVPPEARRILDAGCGEGYLGVALKHADPSREVVGIERQPEVAARAAQCLDQVFTLDLEAEDPPLPDGTIDCIVYGDVLEHLVDPEAVLRRHRRLLRQDGSILCSVPNIQHHSVIAALLRSDFQYTVAGLLDATHLRFFTYSTLIKLLLDSGFAPVFLDDIAIPCPGGFRAAIRPALEYLGLHPQRTDRYLRAYQYIVKGLPLWDYGPKRESAPADSSPAAEAETPLTFAVCVSDDAILQANLLSSPCLGPGSPHEVILARQCRSAAEGLNQAIARAKNDLVVCVHQDVYLPRGWPDRFLQEYRRAVTAAGPVGVVGVYGVSLVDTAVRRAGHVVDRDRLLAEPVALPAVVETLDELLLAVPRGTPLSLDGRLGFHFYGADLCLEARGRGLNAVVLDALCFHHSQGTELGQDFWRSAEAFKVKWTHGLPLATSCVYIDSGGGVRLA